MTAQALANTAQALVAGDKGLLAMDESNGTCNKRFAQQGIPQTEEARRAYRELIVTTPNLGKCISGVILYDETIRQSKKDGTPFLKVIQQAGIIPGIKVDIGAKDLAGHPGETITEGLDGLRARLEAYVAMGARFAKWRAVIALGDGLPTKASIETNAHALARYAALCQEVGLVPIVEPEVLMAGDHTMEECRSTTEQVLLTVFEQLHMQGVVLEGLILKPNMVLPGLSCPEQETVEEVAEATVRCLLQAVPAAVPGDRLPVGRPIRPARVGEAQCDEQLQRTGGAAALGPGLFLRPRHPTAGPGDLARRGVKRHRRAASSVPSRAMQRCGTARRIQ